MIECRFRGDTLPPTLTLPRKGGGNLVPSPEEGNLIPLCAGGGIFRYPFWFPPPLRGRVRVGGIRTSTHTARLRRKLADRPAMRQDLSEWV